MPSHSGRIFQKFFPRFCAENHPISWNPLFYSVWGLFFVFSNPRMESPTWCSEIAKQKNRQTRGANSVGFLDPCFLVFLVFFCQNCSIFASHVLGGGGSGSGVLPWNPCFCSVFAAVNQLRTRSKTRRGRNPKKQKKKKIRRGWRRKTDAKKTRIRTQKKRRGRRKKK